MFADAELSSVAGAHAPRWGSTLGRGRLRRGADWRPRVGVAMPAGLTETYSLERPSQKLLLQTESPD